MAAVLNAPATGAEGLGEGVPFYPSVLDPARIEGRLEKSLLRKVCKLVADFPDRALEVVRVWMAEGR
jgi:flagellar biosynthesis/type III secretory pathway M-ring protein FliF/YscJ